MFRKILETINKACQTLLILFVRLYQLIISPLLGPRCRFYPSCSDYAIEAIQYYGLFLGAWLALKRLIRCQPFCQGGYDPLPKTHHQRISDGL
jgi:putative membrane protein insertion efficiency factor